MLTLGVSMTGAAGSGRDETFISPFKQGTQINTPLLKKKQLT